ncbi:MAG TPA: glycosyltransferase [Cyclobacteriaceae bacterium]
MPDSAIKIFYLDNSADFSGGQKSLLALLSRLDKRNFKPVVVVDRKAVRFKEELKKIGVEFVEINYGNTRFLEIFLVPFVTLKLGYLVLRHDCDLIHANTFKVGLIAAILRKVIRQPVIFRSRLGIIVNCHGFIDRVIYRNCDLILANSHYVKKTYFQRFGNDDKVKVVYNPLFAAYDLNNSLVEDLRQKYFAESGCFYFGAIGRIEPFKRLGEIVEAVRILADKRDHFKVLFIGNVPVSGGNAYKEELIRAIKTYNLEHHFVFTGFLAPIFEATSLLNCVLLCTEGEPLSRGIFESQYLKVPVIASDSGGNPELIRHGETGLLYELGNPADLADKMIKIMDSGETRERIVSNAYSFVKDAFQPEVTIKLEESTYLQLLGRDGAVIRNG